MQNSKELDRITAQLVAQYAPQKILLFGSQAKGAARKNSDFDICAVAEIPNKRRMLTDRYSFASKLNHEGVSLYGGQ